VPNIGTPDWQRGIVSAGKLLATVPAATTSVTVDVPPNAQTLVVAMTYVTYEAFVKVKGVTTGRQYPGALRPSDVASTYADAFYYFSVSSQVDEQVEVTIAAATPDPWYVFSQSGVTVVDVAELIGVVQYDYNGAEYGLSVLGLSPQLGQYASLEIDENGRLIPFGPTNSTGLLAVPTASGQLLAAPASGNNYLFGADVLSTATLAGTVTLTIGGVAIAAASFAAQGTESIDLDGYVTNGVVDMVASQAGYSVALRYTPGP
jgi:hypothetical protein